MRHLRRLHNLGASRETLLHQYHILIRRVLENSSVVFTGGLSIGNISDIENVQESAFKIILKNEYQDYEHALELLDEVTLEERRENIALKFAKKNTNHPKMKHLFQKRNFSKTRSKPKYVRPMANSARGDKCPINFLICLLNNQKA